MSDIQKYVDTVKGAAEAGGKAVVETIKSNPVAAVSVAAVAGGVATFGVVKGFFSGKKK